MQLGHAPATQCIIILAGTHNSNTVNRAVPCSATVAGYPGPLINLNLQLPLTQHPLESHLLTLLLCSSSCATVHQIDNRSNKIGCPCRSLHLDALDFFKDHMCFSMLSRGDRLILASANKTHIEKPVYFKKTSRSLSQFGMKFWVRRTTTERIIANHAT